jgi:very-short-patch-repair endonuclease
MYLAHRIAEMAKWQGRHVTRKQLRAMGLSRMAIEHRVTRGSLIRVHHGVYAVGHLPTTARDRAHGALLAAGARVALAGRPALALWRNDRDWPDDLELISARDVRPEGLAVKRAKTLLQRDIRRVQGLRVTSPARTALDIAAHLDDDSLDAHNLTIKELTRIVNDLRHVNRLRVSQLRDVTTRNPRHPGTKHLISIIGDAQRQPTRSELENAFKRLIKRHRLPTPEINAEVGGETVDAYFRDHDLIVELDGREVTHADDWRPAFENDRRRVVEIMKQTGIPTIRFTYDQITRLHQRTARDLKQILDARLRGAPDP